MSAYTTALGWWERQRRIAALKKLLAMARQYETASEGWPMDAEARERLQARVRLVEERVPAMIARLR